MTPKPQLLVGLAGLMLASVMTLLPAIASPASARTPPRATRARVARPNIVGGSDADPDAFPWLAHVSISDGDEGYSCTGTVISSNLILTAGHCVASDNDGAFYAPGAYSVTTGTQNLADSTERQVSGVTQTFLDGYDPATDDRDVGILELSTPTTAPAIQLATSSASLYAGDGVVIAGWGLTNPSNQNIPTALQYASTVVQQPGFCATNGGSNFAFDPATELCTLDAPYYDNSVCFGDSGGPVIANDLQGEPGTPTEIGVIDSSIDCGTSRPDFYARTDAFLPWADQLIASLTPPASTETTVSPTKSKTELGTFPLALGRTDARTVLGGVFGRRFRSGRQIDLDCGRVSKARIFCEPSWTFGPNDYYGGVSTYLERDKGKVVWTDHYAIRWVNDHCYFYTKHRSSCPTTHRAGTF